MRFRTFLLLFVMFVSARAAEVTAVRTWQAPDQTRLVLDLTDAVKFQIFTIDAPGRLVIDLTQTSISAKIAVPPDGRIAALRHARRNDQDWRLVFDLARDVEIRKALLPPSGAYGNRLVIDLVDRPGASPPPSARRAANTDGSKPAATFVVAIDAGHGGDDTGAIGPGGTYEKDVVLAVARKLKARVDATPGMRGVLIRDGDYYVGLRDRMERARDAHANLFISVHADAFRDSRVRGSSVFVLSPRGASSEAARWLADRENASDFAGGLTLADKDAQLRSVLLDLSQAASRRASRKVANSVLEAMRRLGPVHFKQVQEAGFMVLKSPDIPSILVETAYITNPEEERRLRDPGFQAQLADAMLGGVVAYHKGQGRPDTRLAQGEDKPKSSTALR